MFKEIQHSRRGFLATAAAGIVTAQLAATGTAYASSDFRFAPIRQIKAGVLDIGYFEAGPADGPPVLLLHGFPHSIDSFVDVAPMLAARGARVIVPYRQGIGREVQRTAHAPRDRERRAQPARRSAEGIRRRGVGACDGPPRWVNRTLSPAPRRSTRRRSLRCAPS